MRRLNRRLSLVVTSAAVALVFTTAVPGQAQIEVTKRVDITAFGGWRWGGSVTSLPVVDDMGETHLLDAKLKADASYGGIIDLNVYETWEGHVLLEFYFSQQGSTIQAREQGSANFSSYMDVGSMDVRYYHGGIGYEWKLPSNMSPYILFSLGATQFGSIEVRRHSTGVIEKLDSKTNFSWGFAGGLKYRLSPRFGLRGDIRSFGSSTDLVETGWACGYYDCGLVTFSQTIWQGDVTGGLYATF